jgi:hypothetical protein
MVIGINLLNVKHPDRYSVFEQEPETANPQTPNDG